MSDQQKVPFEEKKEAYDPKKSKLLDKYPDYLSMVAGNQKAISRQKNMQAYVKQRKKGHYRGKNYDGHTIYPKQKKQEKQKRLDDFLTNFKKNSQ